VDRSIHVWIDLSTSDTSVARHQPEPRVGGSSASCQKPKMRKAAAVIHPLPPAHMAARDQRRRSPAESASASRSLVARKACRCSFLQSKEDAAATTACLLPRSRHLSANADGTVFLLGFRRSYLSGSTPHYHHGLRLCPGRLADVVCSTSCLA
jgi:hypothetical protein